MYSSAIIKQAKNLVSSCTLMNLKLATAESCTGGLIAGAITEVSGSSAVFERGYNTYSDLSKTNLLGVSKEDLILHGAVSEEVAIQMAEGALKGAPVQLSVAVTGIAGPDGGTPEKPVGTVHVASSYLNHNTSHEIFNFKGDRHTIRMDTVFCALEMMISKINSN